MILEQIVRPFARLDTLSKRRIVAKTKKAEVSEASLTWGGAGTIPQAEEIPNTEFTIEFKYCDHNYEETSRKSVKKDIHNPDDDSQYVTVARPTQISFKQKKPPYRLNSVTYSVGPLSVTTKISDNASAVNGPTDDGCGDKYNLSNVDDA